MENANMPISQTESGNPWEGKKWDEVIQAYEEGFARWQRGEPSGLLPDCPLDDLMPIWRASLSPQHEEEWEKSNALLDQDMIAEGMDITLSIWDDTGWNRLMGMRKMMGATD